MDFINDDEIMRDFFLLTKDEFLESYSYLKEEDYNATKELVETRKILEIVFVGIDNWDRPVYKDKNGNLYKDVDLGRGNNLASSLCTANNNKFDGEPLIQIDKNLIVKVVQYVPIKDIRKNEDLHKIARQINFETDNNFMPEDTKRDVFFRELETQIEWELNMVSPSVSKKILNDAYDELLKIKTKEISDFRENTNDFLQKNFDYKDFKLNYILVDNKKLGDSIIIARNYDEIKQIDPYTMDTKDIFDWDYNFDEYIFEELEKGKQISYISMETHYNIWNALNDLYPGDIEYKRGVQMYLKYCKDNKITKEKIEKENGLDGVPNAMKYYKDKKERCEK